MGVVISAMNEKGTVHPGDNPNGGIMFKPEEYGPADYMILYDRDGYKDSSTGSSARRW